MGLRHEIDSISDKINHTRLELENLIKVKAEAEAEIERLRDLQVTRKSVLNRLRDIEKALLPLGDVEDA